MKSTQLELIKFCKNIISKWENTDDIMSLYHFNNIKKSVNTELDSYHNDIKDKIYDSLIDLLNTIRKV